MKSSKIITAKEARKIYNESRSFKEAAEIFKNAVRDIADLIAESCKTHTSCAYNNKKLTWAQLEGLKRALQRLGYDVFISTHTGIMYISWQGEFVWNIQEKMQ